MSSLVNDKSSSLALSLSSLMRFSFEEIKMATNDFENETSKFIYDEGDMYRGIISKNSYSGDVQLVRYRMWLADATFRFENAIKVLTARHHANIISPMGFCDEKGEKILVYESVKNSSLRQYLHYTHKDCLTVEQRLEICLGVAKGLSYLHSGTDFYVLHGRIISEDIFLDASLVPKIFGFTYSRTHAAGPSSSPQITINTLKAEYGGYLPPEFDEPGYEVSLKADVYAFGVLLMEVLCERQPSITLLLLTLPFIMKGELPKHTPERVKKNITPACARQCEKLIMNCLEFQSDKRPCMNQVVQDLELALKLQKEQHINIIEQFAGLNTRCQSLSLVEIEMARNELSNQLGKGGFGEVYRGKISINGNNVDVAMKFLSTDPVRGIPAFEIEKKLLLACNHVNIISLVGYCDEKDKKILVYEFMPNGSLYDYLYNPKDDTPWLTVEKRLDICLGVAKGLDYLHSRNDYNIIHSDLKTENILLDANLVPKISDFGLSRTRVVGPSTSSVVTNNIQGTEGYIAPECYEPNYKLSRKADVYAFGVVLLEVLCEKPAWERLVIWALPFVSKGELPKFTPTNVVKNMSPECSRACANLIRDCLEIDPNNRPSMSHVIANLDLVLTLQKINSTGNDQKNKSQANSLQTYSFSNIEMATNIFAGQNLLQEADFWRRRTTKVYYGNINVDVAVKRITGKADQVFGFNRAHYSSLFQEFKRIFHIEINQFQNEIDLLSTCRHVNVISLMGYCDEPDEKILIYEFMPNGSLLDYLHAGQYNPIHLTVVQRLEICLGAAKGLGYVHSSNIIHGYLNSNSILLDRNLSAKISNFKFSRKCVAGLSTSQVVTDTGFLPDYVYLAPECDRFNYKASQEADVYAFGVVFLEVLCMKRTMKNLMVAFRFTKRGEFATLTTEYVRTFISRECAQSCENILRDCLDTDPAKRPSMNQVVEKLELALKLQKEGANY